MIARGLRFRGYNALRGVYQQGSVLHFAGGTLRYRRYNANARRQNYRLAVVVSKKVSKLAVDRNRIRRRVFEAGREVLPPNIPYDIVFTVHDIGYKNVAQENIIKIFSRFLQTVENSNKNSREQK
jgi:ribonuclease P protein component